MKKRLSMVAVVLVVAATAWWLAANPPSTNDEAAPPSRRDAPPSRRDAEPALAEAATTWKQRTIRGRVVNQAGVPIPGARVKVARKGTEIDAVLSSNASGSFEYRKAGHGDRLTFFLDADAFAPDFKGLHLREHQGDIDLGDITLYPLATLRGSVDVPADIPASLLCVFVGVDEGEESTGPSYEAQGSDTYLPTYHHKRVLAPDGTFSMSKLPARPHVVWLAWSRNGKSAGSPEQYRSVVPGRDTPHFVYRGDVWVEGSVYDSETHDPVRLFRLDGVDFSSRSGSFEAKLPVDRDIRLEAPGYVSRPVPLKRLMQGAEHDEARVWLAPLPGARTISFPLRLSEGVRSEDVTCLWNAGSFGWLPAEWDPKSRVARVGPTQTEQVHVRISGGGAVARAVRIDRPPGEKAAGSVHINRMGGAVEINSPSANDGRDLLLVEARTDGGAVRAHRWNGVLYYPGEVQVEPPAPGSHKTTGTLAGLLPGRYDLRGIGGPKGEWTLRIEVPASGEVATVNLPGE